MGIVFGLLTGVCARFAYERFKSGENKEGTALGIVALLCSIAVGCSWTIQ